MSITGQATNIRTLTPEDLEHVLRFRHPDAPVDDPGLTAEIHQWYEQIQRTDTRNAFLITTKAESPIGELVYTQRDSQTGEVNVIRLGHEYRNQGFGTDAMKAFCHHMFSTTTTSNIILFVNEGNRAARRSYQKCGFQEISIQKGRDDKTVLVVMELRNVKHETCPERD